MYAVACVGDERRIFRYAVKVVTRLISLLDVNRARIALTESEVQT